MNRQAHPLPERQHERLFLRGFVQVTRRTAGATAFRQLCRNLGLPPDVFGYGLLLCEDEDGRRVTLVTPDVALHRGALRPDGVPSPSAFPYSLDGWPLDWVQSALAGRATAGFWL